MPFVSSSAGLDKDWTRFSCCNSTCRPLLCVGTCGACSTYPCSLRAIQQDGRVCSAAMTAAVAPSASEVKDLQEVAARLLQLMDAVEGAEGLAPGERQDTLLLTAKGLDLLRQGVIVMAHK